MAYISKPHTWTDPTALSKDVITADKLNANQNVFINGLSDGTKDINVNQITGDLEGNASTATKLKTPRNINITGDAEGTFSYDGTTTVSVASTVPDNKRPIAEGIISLGFNTASQEIMDTIATNMSIVLTSTQREQYTALWGNIQRACSRNSGDELATAISSYNSAFPSDTISAGQITTLNSTINTGTASVTFNVSQFVTLESATNMTLGNGSEHLKETNKTTMTGAAPSYPSHLKLYLDLPISVVGSNTQNLMPFVSCFGNFGYIPDGAGTGLYTSIDEQTPTHVIAIQELSATHLQLLVMFPNRAQALSYFDNTVKIPGSAIDPYNTIPSKVHVKVYKP